MSEFTILVNRANTWEEYYGAFKDAYRHLLEESLALGTAGFAQQLHHTAIPDVTGTMVGSLNWAVYSQPSPQTLQAFLPVFRDLLKAEPHRIRSSRYLFFVADGSPLSRVDIKSALGDLGNLVDFWCGSLDRAISLSKHYALPLSLDALLGDGTLLDGYLSSHSLYSEYSSLDFLASFRNYSLEHLPIATSIAPRPIRRPLIDSSFILASFKLNIDPQQVVAMIGADIGISAYMASNRAKASNWRTETVAYCERILLLCPPKVIEYTVEPGDILSRIVRKHYEMSFSLLWPLIRILNPDIADPNRIFAGQRIRLPDLSETQKRGQAGFSGDERR